MISIIGRVDNVQAESLALGGNQRDMDWSQIGRQANADQNLLSPCGNGQINNCGIKWTAVSL